MLLAVDIGNTHTVIGLFTDQTLLHNWRIQTDRHATADEITSILHGLLSKESLHFTHLSGLILASVVPQLQASWTCFSKSINLEAVLIDKGTSAGLTIRLDNPAEVGADRIVNAVAGYHVYRSSLVIVDFGTATTFDCVSAAGEYLGGAIAPGLAISLEALGEKTARLPRIDMSIPPSRAIGTNTVDAIRSGLLIGYGGLVEGLLKAICQEFDNSKPHIIATGGIASLIAPYAPSIEKIEPNLTLEGLRLIYEKRFKRS